MEALQYCVVEELINAVGRNVVNPATGFLPRCEQVTELYASTPAGSRLRRFLLGVYAFHPRIELDGNLPIEFLAEIAVVLKADLHQENKIHNSASAPCLVE